MHRVNGMGSLMPKDRFAAPNLGAKRFLFVAFIKNHTVVYSGLNSLLLHDEIGGLLYEKFPFPFSSEMHPF